MSTAPLAGPPLASTPSTEPSSLSWEGDKMFNIYIYDYCHKRGFKRTAKELLAEAEIPPDSTPPINARQGLLFEWWSVFWVLFTAKANGQGPDDAMLYTQHQAAQAASRQRQVQMAGGGPQMPPGSQPGSMAQPPPVHLRNGIPPNPNQPRFGPNGQLPNGVIAQAFPSGIPPPQMNGMPGPGGPPNPQAFAMGARGGPPPPGMPGARGAVNGGPPGPPPHFQHSPSAMDVSGGPQNPQTPQQQPGQPGMRMMPPNGGMHPGMNHHPPGQVPTSSPYPPPRPPSRAATPGSTMMASQSPSLVNRQVMDINMINAEISKIPTQHMNALRADLGVDNKDLQNLTLEEKQRLLALHRTRIKPNQRPPNAMAGPSNPAGMQPRNPPGRPPKRNSTSPPDEDTPGGTGSSPKRIRRSPMEQPPMAGMVGAGSYPPGQPPQPGGPGGGGGPPPQHMMMGRPPQGGFNPNMMTMMGGGPMMNGLGGPLSPAMVPNQAGLISQQSIQMMPGRDGGFRPGGMVRGMMPQPGMMTHGGPGGPGGGGPNPMGPGLPASDPTFGPGPPFNGGPPPPGSRGPPPPQQGGPPGSQQPGGGPPQPGGGPGGKAMGMLPPPSPGMMSKEKDGSVKIEGSPHMRPGSTTVGTPSGSGTAPPTPVTANAPSSASQQQPAPPPPPTTMDPTALMSSMGGIGGGIGGGMGVGGGVDMFTPDFVTTIAGSLDDFNTGMFNPASDLGDLNFERDFGQWFDPSDSLTGLSDMTK